MKDITGYFFFQSKYPNERTRQHIAERGTSPFFSHAEREERLAKNKRKSIAKTPETPYNRGRQADEENAALKAFKKLTLADRFIFYRVMQDRELCKRRICRRGADITRI